jgi:hypothetical protein
MGTSMNVGLGQSLGASLGQPLGGGLGQSAAAHGFPYYDDPGSPIADHQQMLHRDPMMRPATAAGGLLHNSRDYSRRAPLRSSYSLDRSAAVDGYGDPYMYRDRSLDRLDTMGRSALSAGQRLRDRSLDRGLDRTMYMRDDPTMMGVGVGGVGGLEADYLRDPMRCATTGALDRAAYSRDGFIMELQARLNEMQTQFGHVKRELDATTQKLGSSMHSIKTFWSPELKKERAQRKEEAAKYALLNDQLKILRNENQVRLPLSILMLFNSTIIFISTNCFKLFRNNRRWFDNWKKSCDWRTCAIRTRKCNNTSRLCTLKRSK